MTAPLTLRRTITFSNTAEPGASVTFALHGDAQVRSCGCTQDLVCSERAVSINYARFCSELSLDPYAPLYLADDTRISVIYPWSTHPLTVQHGSTNDVRRSHFDDATEYADDPDTSRWFEHVDAVLCFYLHVDTDDCVLITPGTLDAATVPDATRSGGVGVLRQPVSSYPMTTKR